MVAETRLGLFNVPFDGSYTVASGERINGSQRAGLDFRSSLYRYGSFDEYHGFIHGSETPPDVSDRRFRVFPFSRLGEALRRYHYTAFHHLNPTLKTRLMSRRARVSKNIFPVTSTTYTISYAYMPSRVFGRYCVYQMYPFDRIFACSSVVKETLSYYFRQIAACGESRSLSWIHPYGGGISVLPLGIDFDGLSRWAVPRAEAKVELGFPVDSCVVLYFGRLSPSTKADLLPLIQVFASLREVKSAENCILVIAGGGDAKKGQSLYSKREQVLVEYVRGGGLRHCIRFFHYPSDELKGKLYSAADLFVSLSDNIQESFGLTVVEAQALGLPVIVSDWDGYRDIVDHGATGFRVPTYWCCDSELDTLSMTKKIEYYHFRQAQALAVDLKCFRSYLLRLVENKDYRLRLGEQASLFARQFHWSEVIRRYEQQWIALHNESEQMTARTGIENLRAGSPRPPKSYDHLRPKFSYHDAFHHFATFVVDGSWTVSLGDIDKLLIEATSGNLSDRLIVDILGWMEERGVRRDSVPLRDLVQDLSIGKGGPEGTDGREEIIRHVMWLFKQGVLHCHPPSE